MFIQRGKDRDFDRAELPEPKKWLELVKALVVLGVPLTSLSLFLTGAFSGETKWAIRKRAGEVSELSGDAVRGLPHHCAHTDHNTLKPDYDDPNNGLYTTIWEHRWQHLESLRRGVVPGTSKLDNGLTLPGNASALELLAIGIAVFEAILDERPEDLLALEQDYAQGRVPGSVLSPHRALQCILEEKTFFTKQYGHLSPVARRELQRKLELHLAHLEKAHKTRQSASPEYVQQRLFVR